MAYGIDGPRSQTQAASIGRRDFFRLSGAGAAGAFLLGAAGCSGDASSAGGQILRAAYEDAIANLDPHGTSAAEQGTKLAATQLYDSLLVRDSQQDGEIVPSLATDWTNPDSRTWEFRLRKDARFHDGTPVTAADVKASLERVLELEGPQAPLWEQLDTVKAVDERTVRITTKEPLGTMLSNLTLLSVLPADKMGKDGFFRKPVGSGPFRMQSFVPSQRLSVSSFTKYWNGSPKVDQLEFPYMPETSARITAMQTGEVDVTWQVAPDQVAQLQGASGVSLKRIPSLYYWFNWFNCGREPFTDARVRRAMWHALDTDKIISQLYGQSARPIRAPLASNAFGYAPQEPYAYDPERAKQLLAEAGYPDGFKTSLMWQTGHGPLIRQFAQTLISYWAKIGVKVEAEELEQAQWLDRLLKLDWDMDLQPNDVATGDADYTLGRLYTSDANRMGYSNEELDRVLIDARTTTDQQRRKELYAQACKIIWDEAVGIYPAEMIATYAVSSNVKGFVPDPIETPSFENVSLQTQ